MKAIIITDIAKLTLKKKLKLYNALLKKNQGFHISKTTNCENNYRTHLIESLLQVQYYLLYSSKS